MVTLIVGGESFELDDERAEQIAVNLRSVAAMDVHDKRGAEVGRPLADPIELRLVGERDDPIDVAGEDIWVLFQDLNQTAPSADDPLYLAVRALVEACSEPTTGCAYRRTYTAGAERRVYAH